MFSIFVFTFKSSSDVDIKEGHSFPSFASAPTSASASTSTSTSWQSLHHPKGMVLLVFHSELDVKLLDMVKVCIFIKMEVMDRWVKSNLRENRYWLYFGILERNYCFWTGVMIEGSTAIASDVSYFSLFVVVCWWWCRKIQNISYQCAYLETSLFYCCIIFHLKTNLLILLILLCFNFIFKQPIPLYTSSSNYPWYKTRSPIAIALSEDSENSNFTYMYSIHRAGVFYRWEEPSDKPELIDETKRNSLTCNLCWSLTAYKVR